MVTIIIGSNTKPISSERLVDFFNTNDDFEGYLYIGYPIIGTVDGPYPIDALLISPQMGLVAFNLVEGRDLGDYKDIQDDSANKIEAKLRGYRQLMEGRKFLVDINVITFAPVVQLIANDSGYYLCNEKNLKNILQQFKWGNNLIYKELLSVLQAISTIRKSKKKRLVVKENSRGAILRKIEDSIANLDNRQSKAVIETVNGVQRIRGLAGSGKTIVLALKAAYLHAQHPEWKIAITFNTRSLKGQFKQLINTFYIEQTNEEPDWDNLQIMQAWGAPGGGERNGIYYTFCMMHGIEYLDYSTARSKFGRDGAFQGACRFAIESFSKPEKVYDTILVDEAQDFSPDFLRICYEMLGQDKRLVYAYDELQNLSSQSLPSPEVIFGNKADGTPRVSFGPAQKGRPEQDIILEKCYRNSRPTLVTAHALGFGIYHKLNPGVGTGLVQIFEQNTLWKEIGYVATSGKLEGGNNVVLERTSESSPLFLEEHSSFDDLIMFKKFDTQEDQDNWITNEIIKNLKEDELRVDDIIVINPEPLSTRARVSSIRRKLYELKINSHITGVDSSPDVFFDADNGSVAFTGIFRAKGNEAAMVYIINAQDCFDSFDELARIRNRLFTAITRSKAWVRVVGVGKQMQGLIDEYEKVKDAAYSLKFTYPTEEQKKYLNIVNRDMTVEEKNKIKKGKNDFSSLIEDLESGKIYLEDLGVDQVLRLKAVLEGQENEK